MDYLLNPLREDHPFGKCFRLLTGVAEIWSPKEMALFNACICRHEKNFPVFLHYVSRHFD